MSAIAWKTVAGIAGGVVLAGSALTAVGLNLPQLATKEEIAARVEAHETVDRETMKRIETRLAQVDLLATQQALESAELRALRLEQEAQRKKAAGENAELIDREVRILKRRTRGLDARVQELLKGQQQP